MRDQVLLAIQTGHTTFSAICSFMGIHAYKGSQTSWRAIDRELQKLRREKKIAYNRRLGWHIL